MKEMKLLGKTIKLSDDYLDIHSLKFLKDNPRVYACTHGEPNFNDLTEEQQQDVIFKRLLEEPSVKNLKPEIKRHGGLMESILVRHDTKEVIEGNSRLAVYRKLHQEDPEGEWGFIPCDIVSSLTDEQQFAFLNQIHVKGKTQWSAYEKANFAYVRKEAGWDEKRIAELFGESESTIRTRVKVIDLMKDNLDNKKSHFSYYDVIVRTRDISKEVESEGLGSLLVDIRNLGEDDDDNAFTAQDLRKKFPIVLKKPKVLKKFKDGEISLEEAYQRARISDLEDKVKRSKGLLEDISISEVKQLEQGSFKAFQYAVGKLLKEVERIKKMADRIGQTE